MLEDKTVITVSNRDNGSVGYTIPDLGNLHRTFQPGESKEVTMGELRKLSYLPGGLNILKNLLIIDNKEAVEELVGEVEPEYYYTEEDIKKLITEGTLEQFEDCLDFAPRGTINLLKKLSVDMKLNDMAKRKALLTATGFNVTNAINANEASVEEDSDETETKSKRRAASIKDDSDTKTRRTTTSRYNVVK